MSDQNTVKPSFCAYTGKESISLFSCISLEIPLIRIRITVKQMKWDVVFPAIVSDQLLIPVRGIPLMVVHMCRFNIDSLPSGHI